MTAKIKYAPPLIKNFGKDYEGFGYFPTPQEEWKAKHSGKFVLSALEDTIKVWALGRAYTHSQVCGECNVEGRVLGGGDISVNDEGNPTSVYSRSTDFGSLPNNVLEEYFLSFGYRVKAQMFEEWDTKGIENSTREWFKKHGVDV